MKCTIRQLALALSLFEVLTTYVVQLVYTAHVVGYGTQTTLRHYEDACRDIHAMVDAMVCRARFGDLRRAMLETLSLHAAFAQALQTDGLTDAARISQEIGVALQHLGEITATIERDAHLNDEP